MSAHLVNLDEGTCSRGHPRAEHSWRRSNGAVACRPCVTHYSYKTRYGISLEEFEQMMGRQDGKCAICSREFGEENRDRPRVDHDHRTGNVRALLCIHCNTIIGMADDNPGILEAAVEYLHRSA